MSSTTKVTYLDTLETLGLHVRGSNLKDASVDCPWCSAEGKLSVNILTSEFRCFKCETTGNITTIMRELYRQWSKMRPMRSAREYAKAVAPLLERRPGLEAETLRLAGLVPHNGKLWFPYRTINGTDILSLKYALIQPSKSSGISPNLIYALPNVSHNLFSVGSFKHSGPLLILEGEWDALMMFQLGEAIRDSGGRELIDYTILAVPGARVFRPEWEPIFTNRSLTFLYDNDEDGRAGQQKAAEMAIKTAIECKIIKWPAEFPPRYDIGDIIRDMWKDHEPEVIQETIFKMTEPWLTRSGINQVSMYGNVQPEQLEKVTSFQSVVNCFKKHYHLEQSFTDGLAVALATIISPRLQGDPIWMFIVGPPGSGKSLLTCSTYRSPLTIFRSSITSEVLVSGWSAKQKERDPSLIPKLLGLCLVLKDYTEVFGMDQGAQEKLYATLRGAFDGHVQRTFGNGKECDYQGHFAFLAGVTNEIHMSNRAALGERFLKFQLQDGLDPSDHIQLIRAAIAGMDRKQESELEVNIKVASYLFYLVEQLDSKKFPLPTVPPQPLDQLIHLAQIVSWLRTPLATNERSYGRDGLDILFRAQPEVASRLSLQLSKLAKCLAIVLQRKEVDYTVMRIVRKVAWDTIFGQRQVVVRCLGASKTGVMTRKEIQKAAEINQTTCHRVLTELFHLGILTSKEIRTVKPGRNPEQIQFTEPFRTLWAGAGLSKKEPKR